MQECMNIDLKIMIKRTAQENNLFEGRKYKTDYKKNEKQLLCLFYIKVYNGREPLTLIVPCLSQASISPVTSLIIL